MRHWLLLFSLVGVVSAVVTSWESLCTKQTDAIPCTVTEGKAHRNDSSDIVVRPHDLRVEPRVKVSPADGGHLLETVLSWETPSQPRDTVKRVTGFQLAIVPLTGTNLNTRYFLFRIPDTVVYTNQFQRFVFTSRGLLLFGESYEIRVWSLPMPIAIDNDLPAQKLVQMPFNPDSQPASLSARFDCRRTSHEDAARWVSGFRRLDLFVSQRKLHVWFVAAPPQYCFQQYKLTMTNTQFEETTVFVSNHELVTERFDNVTIRYGEHVFSNLEPGNAYRVSVIAVERRLDDHRCVCPVRALKTDDLRTGNTICSCTNAESEQLYLEHYEPPPPPATVAPWSNTTAMSSGENLTTGLLFLGMIMLIAVLVVGVSICAITAYFRHLRLKDRAVRIRFIADRTPYKGERGHEAELPFLPKNRVLTIIYAHDSAEHELIVEALARFIGEQLKCSVLLDVWSENDVAKNKAGWIQRSVDDAHYIVFVHSVGARLRYEAAIYKNMAVGRNTVGPLDDIFVPHAHYALQTSARVGGHPPSFVHLRFEYTSDASVLTTATTETVFELPRDATSFVSRMEGAPADALSSRQWLAVQLAIGAMVRRSREEPDWFQGTHCRLGEPAVPTGFERSSDVDGSRWRCDEMNASDVPTIDDDYVPIKKPERSFGNDLDGLHDSGLAVTAEHSICAH